MADILLEMAGELYGERVNSAVDLGDDKIDDLIPLPDVGYLCKYSPDKIEYYGCVEMSKQFVNENTIVIPVGTYFFRHDEVSKLENANEILKNSLRVGRHLWNHLTILMRFILPFV